MRLLLDQGLPRSAAKFLREAGIDTVHVGKIGYGAADDATILQRARDDTRTEAVVFVRDADEQDRVCRLLRALDKNVSIVSLTSEKNGKKTVKEPDDPLMRHMQLADIFAEFCATQLLDTLNIKKVERIRSLFDEGRKIHILLQLDPDPDAIGSALALRELLGRNRTTTPIVTFGSVTRPENLAMIDLLEIQIEQITPDDLHKDGARLAMVDVQPPYFEQHLGRVDRGSRRGTLVQARGGRATSNCRTGDWHFLRLLRPAVPRCGRAGGWHHSVDRFVSLSSCGCCADEPCRDGIAEESGVALVSIGGVP